MPGSRFHPGHRRMAQEIERKFLVDPDRLGPLDDGVEIVQGFIETRDLTVVRVRIAGGDAWLTLKGKNTGAVRTEFEYPIPASDARQILSELCNERVIVKTRYLRKFGGHTWEIDVFAGQNSGLLVAEVELASEDDKVVFPDWVGREVTTDPRYYNVNLLSHPFCDWGDC